MSRPIVYILSKVEKAVAFEWIAEEFLKEDQEIQFILLNDNFETPLAFFLKEREVRFYQYGIGTKKNFPILWIKLVRLLKKIKPQLVHTHLFEASLLGLSAAKVLGIKKRIYTRHHSTFHHEYFPHAVKYDRWINSLASDIVAISSNVKNVMLQKEAVKLEKIHIIEHGFNLEEFSNVSQKRIETLLEKYKLERKNIMIGSIARYINWKGHKYIIRAFEKLYSKNNNFHLILANANGPDKELIQKELQRIPLESYTEISFEEDLFALYQTFDFFVHVPINKQIEAFGQTYVEALAAGVPSIYTLSGIANDFIVNEANALVVEPNDSMAIERAIKRLMEDEMLRNRLIENGKKSVNRFDLQYMISKLKKLYSF